MAGNNARRTTPMFDVLAGSHLRLVGFQSTEMFRISIFAKKGFCFRHVDDRLYHSQQRRWQTRIYSVAKWKRSEWRKRREAEGKIYFVFFAPSSWCRSQESSTVGAMPCAERTNKQLSQYLSRGSRVSFAFDLFSSRDSWVRAHVRVWTLNVNCNNQRTRWPVGHRLRHRWCKWYVMFLTLLGFQQISSTPFCRRLSRSITHLTHIINFIMSSYSISFII